MMHPATRLMLLLSLFIVSTTIAFSQTTNGSVRGAISDPTGAVLPKAMVTVRHLGTNVERKLSTTDDGTYLADNLQPGEYEIKVEATGFQKQIKRISLLTGANSEENLEMTVGASTETVDVTGDAAQINTSDYKVDGVITRERIENLPLNGRSFMSLAALEPGVAVQYDANPGSGGPNNYFRVSIAGAPQQMTRISV